MTASELLDQADALLKGSASNRTRMASWLARSALEEVVRTLLVARRTPTGEASMRSLLTCLEVVYAGEAGIPQRAEYAWAGLSNACHQHAFELTPTTSETVGLVQSVRELVEKAG